MLLRHLDAPSASRDMVDAFLGYDHRARTAENTFYRMQNLSGDLYPIIAPRNKRGAFKMAAGAADPQALLSGEQLTYAAGNKLYFKGQPVMDLNDAAPKKLIAMGAYIVVLPDKVYYNTANPDDHGSIETTNTVEQGVTATLCDQDGETYANVIVSDETPSQDGLPNGACWLDTSTGTPVLKQYAADTALWTTIQSVYVILRGTGIGADLRSKDGVTITGLSQFGAQLSELEGKPVVVSHAETDAIVIPGVITAMIVADGPVTVRRMMPIMDHVFECGNRLWGCRFGDDGSGQIVNEIYCSKLGDFKNWRCYEGISTDSYTATVGSDGAFTGGIAYQGNPLFFKENVLYRVYGAYPAAYQIDTLNCRGVQTGAENSLAILNERLYYKSRGCVCVFDGSYPAEISAVFGDETFDKPGDDGQPSAAAGAINNKYYISMRSEKDGNYHMFKYDSALNAWYREDNTFASAFAVAGGGLYFIDAEKNEIILTQTAGEDAEKKIAWYAETGAIGLESPDHKYISRLTIRLQLTPGSKLRIYAQYDGTSDWDMLASLTGTTLRSFGIPVRPKRCDHFRLRIAGEGDAKIYSIAKTVEQGSDM